MMKSDTFESLLPRPKCSGPKSIGPKYFRAKVYKRAEVFSGPKLFWAEVFPGRSISGSKYFRADVFPGRSFPGRSISGPKYFRAEVSVGPKLSLGPQRQMVKYFMF